MTAAIILSGALIWEDFSLDAVRPRLLVPLANRPLGEYALEWLAHAGVGPVTLCMNHTTRRLRTALGDGARLGVDLCYFEDRLPRGPAGCARDSAAIHPASDYLVLEGSIVPTIDAGEVIEHHQRANVDATVVVDAGSSGGSLRPSGIYVFSRRALQLVPRSGYCDIKEMLLPELHRRELSVGVVRLPVPCPRVDSVESYLVAQDWVLEQLQRGPIPPGYRRSGAALLHTSAEISPQARVLGAVIVGPRAVIEERALLLGPTAIGTAARVGAGAVIGRSTLWESARVGPGARLEQCVVTDGLTIADGRVWAGAFLRPGDAA